MHTPDMEVTSQEWVMQIRQLFVYGPINKYCGWELLQSKIEARGNRNWPMDWAIQVDSYFVRCGFLFHSGFSHSSPAWAEVVTYRSRWGGSVQTNLTQFSGLNLQEDPYKEKEPNYSNSIVCRYSHNHWGCLVPFVLALSFHHGDLEPDCVEVLARKGGGLCAG